MVVSVSMFILQLLARNKISGKLQANIHTYGKSYILITLTHSSINARNTNYMLYASFKDDLIAVYGNIRLFNVSLSLTNSQTYKR